MDVHFGDKLVPGFECAIGIKTKDKPTVAVKIGDAKLAHHLTRLDTELWKVRFLVPREAKGELELDVSAGAETKKEKKAIG